MNDFDFPGSVAVVTGGAGGIGRALGDHLAGAGARVVLVDLDEAAAVAAAAELGGAVGIGADVGDARSVRAMLDRVEAELGPIDVYCSNAGIARGFGLGDDADWQSSWDVHAMAHVHAARHVLPGMVDRRRGAFVVTASAAGLLMMMQSAPYTVTKHASVAIAEWLAVTFGGSGVQVHCLCPQGVRTPMVSSDPAGESEVAASGRILEPAEVAAAVLDAVRANRFLVLPHPEVHDYEKAKVDDRDRWLAGMRRLLARVRG
jgi:NAD(P)-dependent dehydrogenase (short-subunit alcohol dehydrogenase family)